MIEVSEIRKRVRRRIAEARRAAEARRQAAEAAARDYERFLSRIAVPLCRRVAAVLTAEGYPFKVFTPAGGVRLASETSRHDFIELELDTELTPPQVIGRVNRARGGRVVTIERPVRENAPVADLTEADLLEFLLAEIGPFVER